MPEVNVEIDGRKYRMACEDGQEEHLLGLAARFNQKIESLRESFGEIGNNRLTVMAGIAALDELYEAERRIEALQSDVAEIARAGDAMAAETSDLERKFAKRLADAARKVESIATAIDETGQGAPQGG